jgi:lysophospholipase L1-like esterase
VFLTKTLLVAGALVVGLGLAEGALRLALPPRTGYFVIAPGTSRTLRVDPHVMRGVDTIAHYRINSIGVRGRLPSPHGREFRVLAVGGSTTECAALDDTLAWPHLLERLLSTPARPAWVANVGKSGLTSREHVLHLKYLLPQYRQIDAVIVLVGVNDMLGALKQGNAYHIPEPITSAGAERVGMRRAFAVFPGMQYMPPPGEAPVVPWYRTTALWDVARRAKLRWSLIQTHAADAEAGLVLARAHRQGTPHTDRVPPLELPLAEYRRNLEVMATTSRTYHARLILLTQPAVWHQGMSVADQRSLWLGWVGEIPQNAAAYYSPTALARAMDAYNAVTREVCAAERVECVDLATDIPKTAEMFYDDVHFTNAGAGAVASTLAHHFAPE